ncbi:MAG: hypothetical protein FWD61_08470 [Phycisphaerales bacterium]|nr:hypothetical protein [Phycisphaerales bacterium]
MRDLINKYAYPIAGVAIVLAILLFIFNHKKSIILTEQDVKAIKTFYVDDETGEEVVLPANELPPRMGKNGKPTLVKAHKFTRDGGQTEVIAYLEKYSDEAAAALKSMPDSDSGKPGLLDHGRMIRLPGEGQKWVPIDSPEAEAIRATPIPGDGRLEEVRPK